jgi:hypothetical protein
MREGAEGQQDVTLAWIECRCLLSHYEWLESTVSVTTSPWFHDRVQRYRKTGKL